MLLDCCVAELALHTREMPPRRTGDKQHPVLHFEYADGDDLPKGLPFNAGASEIEPEPARGRLPELLKGLGLPETATRSICAALKAQS